MQISLATAIGILSTEGRLELQVPIHEYQFDHPNYLGGSRKRYPSAYVYIPLGFNLESETRISVDMALGADIQQILQANNANDESHQVNIPSMEVKKIILDLQAGTIQLHYRFLRNDEVERSYSIKEGSTCVGDVYRIHRHTEKGLSAVAIREGFTIYW